jgi:hypothetical protein
MNRKDQNTIASLYMENINQMGAQSASKEKMASMLSKHPAYYTPQKMSVALNDKLVDKDSIVVGGVRRQDAPEFANAYFTFAKFDDGTELQPDELEQLDQQYGEMLNNLAAQSLQG